MNKIFLMGRLATDPEVRTSKNGKAVGNFSLAVDRRFAKEGEQDTDFFRCVCFGKTADTVENYLHKGMKIMVEGEMHIDQYTDKDGAKKSAPQVILDRFEFCEKLTPPADTQPKRQSSNDGFMHVPDNMEDDFLPFN